jgi:hypothetical protein
MAYLGLAGPDTGTTTSDGLVGQWEPAPQAVEYKVISGAGDASDLEMALNFAALDGWALLVVVPTADGPSKIVMERRCPSDVVPPA